LTSFFVYLEANCTGGNTVFLEVPRPQAPEWCDALTCLDENGEELNRVEVKPKVGTAIFWYNLDTEGNVDRKTLHAGAPVTSGTKIGMNIWTRERYWRI
jgi:prolyl 4-hydroxylase